MTQTRSEHTKWTPIVFFLTGLLAAIGVGLDLSLAGSVPLAWRMLSYYTIQTNLMVAVVMLAWGVMLWRAKRQPNHFPLLAEGLTLWILVTHLVYHFMLSSVHNPTGIRNLTNILMHYVTPWLMVLCFLLLFPIRKLHFKAFVLAGVYPAFYVIASMIRGSLDGFYPYWFLKPFGGYPNGNESYGQVMLMCLVILILFYFLGLVLLGLRQVVRGRHAR